MREIKFRGKRVDNGEWVEGNLFQETMNNGVSKLCIITDAYFTLFEFKDENEITGEIYEVIPETVGQSLNKQDVNSKEMFGGDIVKVKYEDVLGIEREAIGVIQMGELWWEIDFPFYGITVPMDKFFNDEHDDFEVIGNETENPELLK